MGFTRIGSKIPTVHFDLDRSGSSSTVVSAALDELGQRVGSPLRESKVHLHRVDVHAIADLAIVAFKRGVMHTLGIYAMGGLPLPANELPSDGEKETSRTILLPQDCAACWSNLDGGGAYDAVVPIGQREEILIVFAGTENVRLLYWFHQSS